MYHFGNSGKRSYSHSDCQVKTKCYMLNVVIFGAPGSGKGTQSELIIKEYALDHISTGDVLRSEMKNETELGKIAKDYIEKGQLVPDELIVNMLAKVLDSKANSKGVILMVSRVQSRRLKH